MAMVKERNKNAEHYVSNKEFNEALIEYNRKKKENPDLPLPDFLSECLIKIATRLSYSRSFSGYTFRDEMVLDAIEYCLKAVKNYDPDAITRSGTPNPFSYFTMTCYNAFLQRLKKENRHIELKSKLMKHYNIMEGEDLDSSVIHNTNDMIVSNYYNSVNSDVNFRPEEKPIQIKDADSSPLEDLFE